MRMSWKGCRGLGVGCLAVAGAAVVAGCGGSSGTATGASPATTAKAGSITVYSGQHEQTMGKLVADFERRTGMHVKLRSNDEASLANQILREGSRLARRRLRRGEPAGADGPRAAGTAGARRRRDAAHRCRRASTRRRATGSRCPRARPCWPTTPAAEDRPAAGVAARPRQAAVEGPRRLRADRDRLPAADHRRRDARAARRPR